MKNEINNLEENPNKRKYWIIAIGLIVLIIIAVFLISILKNQRGLEYSEGGLGSLSPAQILKNNIGKGPVESGEIIQRSINKIDFEELNYKISSKEQKLKEKGFNKLKKDSLLFEDSVIIQYNKELKDYPTRIEFSEGLPVDSSSVGVTGNIISESGDSTIINEAESFFDEYEAVLGIDSKSLEEKGRYSVGALEYISFNQNYNGIFVYSSNILLVQSDNKWMLANLRYFNDINVNTNPKISENEAANIAKKDLFINEEPETSQLVIYPYLSDKDVEYYLAYKLDFPIIDVNGQDSKPSVFVDAINGKVIDIIENVKIVEVSGNIYGYIFPDHTNQSREKRNFANEYLDNGNGITDIKGNYSYNLEGTSYFTKLEGPYVVVLNEIQDEAIANINVPPYVNNINWSLYDNSYKMEESNVFYHVNRIHDFFTQGPEPFTINELDYQMQANVELSGTCNAFATGTSINFYKPGGGCEALSLSSDVIYHEYTHNMVFNVAPTLSEVYWGHTGNMNEGYSDYYACSLNNNSCLSDYFFYDAYGFECLRNCENTKKYPQNYNDEPHYAAEIISGSIWDIRKEVGAEVADTLALVALSYDPQTFQELADNFLISDDAIYGNADLSDGSPNGQVICNAFYINHGIYSSYCFNILPLVGQLTIEEGVERHNLINITGSAGGTEFDYYVLSYYGDTGGGGSGWIELVTNTNPVNNNVLYNDFDTTLLPDGVRLIKLIVYDVFGNFKEVRSNNLKIKNLEITSIGNNFGYIKGIEEVRGNIYFNDYNEYFVEYQNKSWDWEVLCSNTEKPSSDLLCNVDVSNLENGAYDFRVSIIETDGKYHTGTPFRGAVFKELMEGWPIEFYGFPNDIINLINDNGIKKIVFKTFLECVDGQGIESEVSNRNIVQSSKTKFNSLTNFNSSYNPSMSCGGNALYLYNSDGTLFTYASSISGKNVPPDDAIAVYSKDESEYIATVPWGNYFSTYKGLIYPNGSEYKQWNNPSAFGESLTIFEDQFFNMAGEFYPIKTIYINGFDIYGDALPNFPITINQEQGSDYWYLRMPVVFPNQEGSKSIAIMASNYDYDSSEDWGATNSTIYLDIYSSQDASLIKRNILYSNFSKKIQAEPVYMVTGDVNNDGRTEIVLGLGIVDLELYREDVYNIEAYSTYFYVIDDLGNIIAQSNEMQGYMPHQIALAKSSGSNLLIVATLSDTFPTTYDGQKIIVFDNLMNIKVEVNLEDYRHLIQGMTIGDVDSDEESEIVVNYRQRRWNGDASGIHIFNLDGTKVKEIVIPTTALADDYWSRYPILTDFDGDGNVDIVQQSLLLKEKDGSLIQYMRIYAYTLGETYRESNIEWPMFLHDPQHTALYSEIPRPISRLKNNHNYPVTGNLTLELQKELGGNLSGNWIIERIVVNQEITIPALGSVDISNYWNNKNVIANELGNYRIHGRFDVEDEFKENDWEFVVEGQEVGCYDSDGGINYYEKGTTYGYYVNNTDYCNGNLLQENYCLNNNQVMTAYTCPNGCSDGACIGNITCYSDSNCPPETNYYCSGNSSCSSTTYFICLNPGTINSECSANGGGGGCTKPCANGCDIKTGKCIETNATAVSPLLRFFKS